MVPLPQHVSLGVSDCLVCRCTHSQGVVDEVEHVERQIGFRSKGTPGDLLFDHGDQALLETFEGDTIDVSCYPESIVVPGVAELFTPTTFVVVGPPSYYSRVRNAESRFDLNVVAVPIVACASTCAAKKRRLNAEFRVCLKVRLKCVRLMVWGVHFTRAACASQRRRLRLSSLLAVLHHVSRLYNASVSSR